MCVLNKIGFDQNRIALTNFLFVHFFGSCLACGRCSVSICWLVRGPFPRYRRAAWDSRKSPVYPPFSLLLSAGLGLNPRPALRSYRTWASPFSSELGGGRVDWGVAIFCILTFTSLAHGSWLMLNRSWRVSGTYVLCSQSSAGPPCPNPPVLHAGPQMAVGHRSLVMEDVNGLWQAVGPAPPRRPGALWPALPYCRLWALACPHPWLWLPPPFWDTSQVPLGANGRKPNFLPQEMVRLVKNIFKD